MTGHARLAGKRALVTGGSRGIGAAIVRRLAADGAAVAVNYVADQAAADQLVAELTSKGHQVRRVPRRRQRTRPNPRPSPKFPLVGRV
jgi:3-oxoacyl-[acyl-carrier protein] reductase